MAAGGLFPATLLCCEYGGSEDANVEKVNTVNVVNVDIAANPSTVVTVDQILIPSEPAKGATSKLEDVECKKPDPVGSPEEVPAAEVQLVQQDAPATPAPVQEASKLEGGLPLATAAAGCEPELLLAAAAVGAAGVVLTLDTEQPKEQTVPATISTVSLDTHVPQDPLRPLHAILVFLSVVVPNAVLIICFSSMGFGLDLFNEVANLSLYGDFLLCGATALTALMLIIDWWRFPRILKVLTGVVPLVIFCAGSVCKGRKYPWASMLVCLLFMPIFLGVLRFSICKKVKRTSFYGCVCLVTFVTALTIGVIWGVYVLEHRWNQDTKHELVRDTLNVYKYAYQGSTKDLYANGVLVLDDGVLIYGYHCGPNKDTQMLDSMSKKNRADIKKGCTTASTVWFLCWMCPFIAIGCDVVVSAFCLFTGVLGKVDDAPSVQRILTRFVLVIAFLLAGLYACATMSATSLRLGSTLMAFFATAVVILFIWVYLEIDMAKLRAHAAKSKLVHQLSLIARSDWTKALGVGLTGGPIMAMLVINYCTQACRRCRGAAGEAGSKEAKDWCTPAGRKFANAVGVAKLTYIFLSWLIHTALAETSIVWVCVLVYFIGCCMFLLPPVPGLPVYIFAGILLGSKGKQDENVGFWMGCVIASVLGLFTKVCACVGQYMIGYFLGKSIKVQQLIGVDKVPTRAVERVLKSRGLNPGKVSVLVGGPDWPTSVTCGIIGVNIPQMIIGTIPVVTLLAPCVLAGACMGQSKPGEDSDWNMLANGFTAFAGGVNMASMAYAAYTISNTIQNHGDELSMERPEHEAVTALTKKEQAAVEMYHRTVDWNQLSCLMKIILMTAAIGMVLSNMLFVGLAELCFRPFSVSSEIGADFEDDGLENNAREIIRPLGEVCVVMFFVCVFIHIAFVKVMASRAATQLRAEGGIFSKSSLLSFKTHHGSG